VVAHGRAASAAAASLAAADDERINAALRAMADRLTSRIEPVLAANRDDLGAAKQAGMAAAMVDRLLLDAARITSMADQLRVLAEAPFPPVRRTLRDLPDGLCLQEWRRPVGVLGANFEARPNVTLDVASQLVKSRNAGVLRTGSAALRSAGALIDEVIAPALSSAGLDGSAVQLIRTPERWAAFELVRHADLIPLVILRGSGASTRALSHEAARNGVRTLAHADGGGVLYVDQAADQDRALALIERGLDRLGVCNRLNLLLVHEAVWPALRPPLLNLLDRLGVRPSLPPHRHPRGHEWALEEGQEATVTVDTVGSALAAATIANTETSGLAATVVTEDESTAGEFLAAYAGTGAFWNATTRLLDGFKLLALPETGINVDHVPGPRGPVTFADLYLRQYVVLPSAAVS
jgi:glutamate-5-semialdehyde dehydrogenase